MTVIKVNKSDGEITSNDKITNLPQITGLLQPTKLRPVQMVIKEKKQPLHRNNKSKYNDY